MESQGYEIVGSVLNKIHQISRQSDYLFQKKDSNKTFKSTQYGTQKSCFLELHQPEIGETLQVRYNQKGTQSDEQVEVSVLSSERSLNLSLTNSRNRITITKGSLDDWVIVGAKLNLLLVR